MDYREQIVHLRRVLEQECRAKAELPRRKRADLGYFCRMTCGLERDYCDNCPIEAELSQISDSPKPTLPKKKGK